MTNTEYPIGETIFVSHMPEQFSKRAGASLAELSRNSPRRQQTFASDMNARVDKAWEIPIQQLTCEQVRLLTNQGAGLQWLAELVAEFVVRLPRAWITHYPGDLAMAVWSEFDKFREASPTAAEKFLTADFSWMPERYGFSRALRRDAENLLAATKR